MATAIEIKNLSHRFGLSWALRNIVLEIAAGECVAILGPNASGKSTLLKIMATRLKPTRGEVRIFGLSLQNGLGQIRSQTEWLGHELGLYKNLSAQENLAFHFKMKGQKPSIEKIETALNRVKLNGNKNNPISTFSSGQRKRLTLARILLAEPKIILLDEPHTNLDQEGKKLMNDLITNWQATGKTLCLASHDHKEILPLCSRALHLLEGGLVS